MNVYVSGRDGVGWALDVQRKCLIDSLGRLGHRVVGNPLLAKLVVTVNWAPLHLRRYAFLHFKKALVLATNYIDLDDPKYAFRRDFDVVTRRASAWISPSHRQSDVFTRHGVRSFYQPFYLEDVFLEERERPDKRTLCERLGVDYSRVEGRMVIASIQRDTEGSDLRTPKLVKGPDLLFEILKQLPDRDRFVLLLSGPRRHYLLSACREAGIPYVYAGKEPGPDEDDVLTNLLPAETVPWLYQLADLYLVTSRSEGGPKAVMEGAMLRTLVFSTDVGLAPDFLAPECVFRDTDSYAAAVREAVAEFPSPRMQALVERHYRTATAVLNRDNMDALLEAAIDGVMHG